MAIVVFDYVLTVQATKSFCVIVMENAVYVAQILVKENLAQLVRYDIATAA